MRALRQVEAAELMATAGNFTASYAKALLAATRQSDLVHSDKPKAVGGLTSEQMARMEREMAQLQTDLKGIEARYGDDVLVLVVAARYLGKVLRNTRVKKYLGQRHPEMLAEFTSIVAATSLDQSDANSADTV